MPSRDAVQSWGSSCFQVKHWIIRISIFSSSIPCPLHMFTTSSPHDWSDSFQLHQGAQYKSRHHNCLLVECHGLCVSAGPTQRSLSQRQETTRLAIAFPWKLRAKLHVSGAPKSFCCSLLPRSEDVSLG